MTAVYCDIRVSSAARLLDLYQPEHFRFEVSLPNGSCGVWVSTNTSEKLESIERKMLSTLRSPKCNVSDSGRSVSCVADSQWTCHVDDNSSHAIFE